MYLNISLFNQAGKEIQKVQVDEKFNLTNFLNTHHYFIEDIDLKKFIRDINQAWNKNIKQLLKDTGIISTLAYGRRPAK